MKKRIFSLLAVVLFAGSLMSVSSSLNLESDCYEKVELAITQAANAGMSAYEITWVANAFEAHYCYGYSWEDILTLGY